MGRSQINIRVDDADKQAWKDAVDESNEYKDLTHLIELAVTRELNVDQPDMVAATGGGHADSAVSNGDLLEAVMNVDERVKAVSSRVNEIGRESSSVVVPVNLIGPMLDELPTAESDAIHPSQVAESMEHVTTENARTFLQQLDERTNTVASVERDAWNLYYKDE